MSPNRWELKPESLRAVCDPDALGFETTLDVSPLKEKVVAQDRAVHALEFGLGVKDLEYNIFVAGPPRAGKTETIMAYVQELAATEPTPPDYIYVHNFKDPEQPQSLSLPTGKGRLLKADMEVLISNLKMQVPEVFESEDYSGRREALMHGFTQERNKILQELDAKAGEEGFILNISPTGLMIFPGKEGKPLSEDELKALNDEDREALRQKSAQLHTEMNEAIRKIRKMEKEFQEQEKKLDQDVALYVVGHHMEELREKYQDLPQVLDYLKDVQEDILKNIDDLKRRPGAQGPFPFPMPEPSFIQYQVNVFVDHSETKGAPVIMENNPTYPNLFGAVERRAQFGALVTDFTLIRAGALQRANGGYLVLEALDLLRWFFSYEALKRCLKNGEVKIEDPMEMFGMITTRSLQPQPIPLNIKIILVGDPYIYQLLYIYDEDFHKFFKIKAQFDWRMRKTDDHLRQFCELLAGYCRDEETHAPPQDRHGPPGGVCPGTGRAPAKAHPAAQRGPGRRQRSQLLGPEQHPRGDLGLRRGQGHRREDLSGRPAGRKAPGVHRRRDALHRDRGPGGGPDERPVGIRPGGPRLRPPVPDHRQRRPG